GSGLPHDGALRSIFHGPPLTYLEQVLDDLSSGQGLTIMLSDGALATVPVLLPEGDMPAGYQNPAVGISGRCDESHILALRNTPACPRFLTLAPPGRQSILSVTQATDSFGMSPANNSGNA